MPTALFTKTLKPGKFEAYKAFVAEITGPRSEEFSDLLHRYGLKNVKFWHPVVEGTDYILVFHEMEEDAFDRLANWDSSTHPFDLWFSEQILACCEGFGEPVELLCEYDPH